MGESFQGEQTDEARTGRENNNRISETNLWICFEAMRQFTGCRGSLAGNRIEGVSCTSLQRRHCGSGSIHMDSGTQCPRQLLSRKSKNGRYLCNILLDEPSSELIALRDKVYCKAARLFANDLFDELTRSGIVSDPRIECGQTVPAPDSAGHARADDNFILWSLIPYIAAHSGEAPAETNVSFEEAAAMRPDGGFNICHASVAAPNGRQPMYYESMQHLRGPCWNQNQEFLLWQMDSEWSSIRVTDGYMEKAKRILSILSRCKKAVTIRLVRRILPFLKRTELQRGNLTAAKEKRSLYSFPGWFGWKAAR